MTLDEIRRLVGAPAAVSDWLLVDQATIEIENVARPAIQVRWLIGQWRR